MASRSGYRPRRTRIYGANYDIGESYYKKQLDNLDNKKGTGRFSDTPFHLDMNTKEDRYSPKVSFLNENNEDDLFKYTPKNDFKNKSYLVDDSDDEYTLPKIKSIKPKLDSTFDDDFFGENIKTNFLKKHDFQAKERTPLANDFNNEIQSGFTSRRIKIRSENVLLDDKDASFEAVSRAKASKARLADLESEMLSITEKQNEREKRKHGLRKLLGESESDTLNSLKKLTL
ncbi:uncharacterized protein LOC119669956 [Teleopsis dalmanni]|uniref:uncharacterized protein LOC119669956 n=1 Tax=Teleopsis dalmanni TaxID=139649 RepID=UPI0018CEB5B2|nr:uncharacterized protein LOC119669956 [Teleopsis dalmanni]